MSTQITSKTAGSLHWYHWLVVAASLVLTLGAWYISKSQIEEKKEQSFEFQANQLIALVSERMSRYEDALRAGVAMIHSQQRDIDAAEWKGFADTLKIEEIYPGINGIGVIYYVPAQGLDGFLQRKRQLRPDFKIHPKHQQDEFWPITYVEPVATNAQAVGLDMAFEHNRFSAAKKARDTGTTQITAPIVLVQDARKTPGFLQFVPFYTAGEINTIEQRKQQFVGHVYAPFIMYKLMQGTLKQSNRQLIFSVYDGEYELYDELHMDNIDYDANPLFSKKLTIDIYGRPWQFTIETTKSFRVATQNNQSSFILIGGIIIDSMLLALFFVLSRSEEKAITLANQMTDKLSIRQAYFQHIIEAAPCGMVIINHQGLIEQANPHACKMFQYEPSELEGKSIEMLVPRRAAANHPGYRQAFMNNPSQRRMARGQEVLCRTKIGTEFPAEIGLAHFHGEGGLKVLATIVNMTEHVEVTNELKRSNKELNEFAYVASHDLKAPLRGIMQLSSWIEEDTIDSANDETKENLWLLKNRVSRLEKLLDDLLAYSRIGRKSGEITTVDTHALFINCFELQDPPKQMKLEFVNDLPTLPLVASPLESIVRNLLGNAIKHHHNPDEGIIRVQFNETEEDYEFTVCDNGPGIPEKHHTQIFDLFKTLRPRDEVEGSGMGLSIIKKLLDYHKGTITLDSDGQSGSCFTFTWPKKNQ